MGVHLFYLFIVVQITFYEKIPGKNWFIILRRYGPLVSWINKAWRPGEIELVK